MACALVNLASKSGITDRITLIKVSTLSSLPDGRRASRFILASCRFMASTCCWISSSCVLGLRRVGGTFDTRGVACGPSDDPAVDELEIPEGFRVIISKSSIPLLNIGFLNSVLWTPLSEVLVCEARVSP